MHESEKLIESVSDGIITERIDGIGREDLKQLTLRLKNEKNIEIVILGTALENGGAAIAAAVSESSSRDASELISEAAKLIKGGGGKGKVFAMAGGKDSEALDEALAIARKAAMGD